MSQFALENPGSGLSYWCNDHELPFSFLVQDNRLYGSLPSVIAGMMLFGTPIRFTPNEKVMVPII